MLKRDAYLIYAVTVAETGPGNCGPGGQESPPPPTHTHSFPKVLHKEGCSDDTLKCVTTANQYEFHIWDLGTIAWDYVRYKVGECLSLFYG